MTRRDLVAERHGSSASSGADSFKSTDTVRNIFGSGGSQRRRPNIETKKEDRYVPTQLNASYDYAVKELLWQFVFVMYVACRAMQVECFSDLGSPSTRKKQQRFLLWIYCCKSKKSRNCVDHSFCIMSITTKLPDGY
jgi:hypothetical protein